MKNAHRQINTLLLKAKEKTGSSDANAFRKVSFKMTTGKSEAPIWVKIQMQTQTFVFCL